VRKSRRELRDSPTPACRLPVIRRQNRLRQKTHFASRLKQISLSNPRRTKILLSFLQKL
jgi:hypothetical protein